MTRRPNILLIVTDEERAVLPHAEGYALPARERIAARGTTFDRYYTASAQCSSARSVIYTGQHDVVLYDRREDPAEMRNLAADPANDDLVTRYSALLEGLITAEIGADTRAWVTERPRLLGWPTWHGDVDQPTALATA